MNKVEIELVLFDFGDGHHAGVAGNVEQPGEHVHDPVDILRAKAVHRAVLHEALAGGDEEDAFAGVSVFLVDGDDAGGNAGAVEQVGGQPNDSLDVATADEIAANLALGIATEEDAVGQNAGTLAGALQ